MNLSTHAPVAGLPRLLGRINHGYDHLAPVLLGLVALGKHILLIGRHGTGKTRLARILASGIGDGSFAFFDATKDDLVAIAGIPDVTAMQDGVLRFVPHARTIWGKTTIVVDEITRATRENQNLWLEILEARTCFGLPLACRCIIATANPTSYAAAFQLDEALLDRFHAVLPVPEFQEGVNAEDVTRDGGARHERSAPCRGGDGEYVRGDPRGARRAGGGRRA
jgi:MoxR-like ATPase